MIRAATYFEAWCDHDGGHLIELGDEGFSAYTAEDLVMDGVMESEGAIDRVTGAVYCWQHIPPTLCRPSGGLHEWSCDPESSCLYCGADRPADQVGA